MHMIALACQFTCLAQPRYETAHLSLKTNEC